MRVVSQHGAGEDVKKTAPQDPQTRSRLIIGQNGPSDSALLGACARACVPRRYTPSGEGQAIGSLVYNLVLGGEHLSDLEVVRGDAGTQELVGAESVRAPTTAGEFLRKFDIGDVQDLQRVHLRLQPRVRPQQPSPTCTLDLDSSIYEQAATPKEG